MKILIVKLGSIGDIVHTLPSLAAMRAAFARCRDQLGGREPLRRDTTRERPDRPVDRGGHPFAPGRRIVAEIIPRFREQFRPLRRQGFDVAIDFQGLLKSAAIAKLSGAKRRYGFAREGLREPASRIFLTNTVDIPGKTHIVRKNLMLASSALGIPAPRENFEFPIFTTEEHISEAERIIAQAAGEFAVLNPAGGWVTKLWPAARFGELADILWERWGLRSIIAVAPNESALAEEAVAASRFGNAVFALPSLKGFYELARRARVYVGGDTGPTHLAVAAGAPVVGIFGPTEWWRNGSTDPRDICVERVDIGCRVDCHRRRCSNWICMEITAETVAAAVGRRIGDTF